MNKIFILLFLSMIYVPTISHADEIFIESEELLITREPLVNTFFGNVYAYDDEIRLWSDKVIIFYTEGDNKIDIIEIIGNGRLIRGNQEVLSDSIIYKVIDKKIYAKGNITLTQGQDIINGDELNIDLVKSTSIIKSEKQNKVKVKINKDNE